MQTIGSFVTRNNRNLWFFDIEFWHKPIMSDNVMWFYAIQLKQINFFFLCLKFNVIWLGATKLKPASLYIFSFELCCNFTKVYEVWTSFLVCFIHSISVIYKCSVHCEMLHYKIVVELNVVLVLVFKYYSSFNLVFYF